VPAHGVARTDQIARAAEQIREVEHSGRCLQYLIALGGACELALEACREVRVGVVLELLQADKKGVARRKHLGSGCILAELVAAALPRSRESAVARQIDQTRLPAVEVAMTERLLQPNLATES